MKSVKTTIITMIKGEFKMENRKYDPRKDGDVVAIRIFNNPENPYSPNAELAFAFGGSEVIEWTNPSQRAQYIAGINGYTFIFDERERREFKDFIKPRYEEWLTMQNKCTC